MRSQLSLLIQAVLHLQLRHVMKGMIVLDEFLYFYLSCQFYHLRQHVDLVQEEMRCWHLRMGFGCQAERPTGPFDELV